MGNLSTPASQKAYDAIELAKHRKRDAGLMERGKDIRPRGMILQKGRAATKEEAEAAYGLYRSGSGGEGDNGAQGGDGDGSGNHDGGEDSQEQLGLEQAEAAAEQTLYSDFEVL